MGALWRGLLGRWPGLRWLETWGISFASLVLGLLTLFVFRRGLPHVGWVAGYLLLLWLLFAAFSELEATLREQGRHRVAGAGAYAIQSLYHGVLLFVLPAYYAATTLGSRNVFFLVAVAGGALLTAVDPWYRRLVGPRPWLGHVLLAFSIFAALNVALPLVGLRPILALEMSAVLAVVALLPAFRGTAPSAGNAPSGGRWSSPASPRLSPGSGAASFLRRRSSSRGRWRPAPSTCSSRWT